ncbi:hypothetical protein N7520_010736 [Penicillium odoratum]|uniref:uncharacterized protein n=1 Tax=Penicillium odoratum TaxID=1167516 RepID=UPI002548512D|nr:uncharacterized protein N7520_010736 [Penicillium odoratum]KAJ5745554.1 hypothetical protein N7520_010736 [Penicillium odoratum]
MASVLRFARSDRPNEFVLLHVVNAGPAPLDLTLTATEGECPYTARVQESHLKSLCAKNYQGSDEEWTQTIAHVLGQATLTQKLPAWSGVEASIAITGLEEENKEMIITVRKRVQSITQRLGAITLQQDDEKAIELFEWSGLAASRASELGTQVIDLTERCLIAEDTVRNLNKQLETLTRAKTQHETQLVANFVQLLNEKKLKIRNQQRLLASATADPTKVLEIQSATIKHHATGEATKRNVPDESDGDGDTEKGFQEMEIDEMKADNVLDGQDTDDEGLFTPQPLEEGNTTTDDEFDSPELAQSTAKSNRTRDLERSLSKEATPPPRRELPFSRREPSAKKGPASALSEVAGETAGETDDDEL